MVDLSTFIELTEMEQLQRRDVQRPPLISATEQQRVVSTGATATYVMEKMGTRKWGQIYFLLGLHA